jgi:hypothetical protein
MPTANYDASILTKRKRATALFTFYSANNASVNAGTSVRREQPDTQLGEVVCQRNDTKANTNPTGSCPCTTAVVKNTGGDNGNNF